MAPEVRLFGPDNEALGVVSLQEALRLAGEYDVDLVETVAAANPPVCRLIEYGKFKFLEQKKAAEAKSKQKVIEVKEIKFRPGTDDGDYNIKMRNIRRFLDEGDKCKITLRFRGREITHQELGLALLQHINFASETMSLLTPVAAERIRIIQCGEFYVSPEGQELARRAPRGL
jgi:translation initiation factor IF-3